MQLSELSNIQGEHVVLALSFVGLVCLLVDLVVRWKYRENGVVEITDWRGFIPLPYLAIFGGVSTFVCGWVGWGLLVAAALAATEAFKISATAGVPWEKAIVIRSTMVFHILTVASLGRYCLEQFVSLLG